MKVTIHGKPTFTVKLNRSLADELIVIATMHYDSVCKRAGCPGGFLYGFWINFELDSSLETHDATMSWRDADTLLKILEVRHYMTQVLPAVEDLNRSLHHAMQCARDLDWKIDCAPHAVT